MSATPGHVRLLLKSLVLNEYVHFHSLYILIKHSTKMRFTENQQTEPIRARKSSGRVNAMDSEIAVSYFTLMV